MRAPFECALKRYDAVPFVAEDRIKPPDVSLTVFISFFIIFDKTNSEHKSPLARSRT